MPAFQCTFSAPANMRHSLNTPSDEIQTDMNVLVIGAYGLIGIGVTGRLLRDGHNITGLGRDIHTGQRVLPSIRWQSSDLRALTDTRDWLPFLEDIDTVVNCSGALQEGPDDDLEAVHHHAISALAKACASADIKIVQISAVGASLEAPTSFLASKARGDDALRKSGVRHCIFRPGLVLAPHSYGGTTMLRMLAAFPAIQPISMAQARIQTVSLEDVAEAVSAAVRGTIPHDFEANLVENETHSLREVVKAMRHWLGFKSAKHEITISASLTRVLAKIADGLAHLRWRSPLRTTALVVLSSGVTEKPTDLAQFGLPPLKSLAQTLTSMPARAQDRLFARMALLMPVIITTLFVFWSLSGLIGLIRANQAAHILENAGWSHALALASVLFWSFVDLAIAAAFAYRPTAKLACWLAIGVSTFYLASSTLFVPHLWLDPLGSLVKILPGIALALVARIALETR